MNALNYLAVNCSLETETELTGRFRLDGVGGGPMLGDAGERESPAGQAEDAAGPQAESPASRSMWRTFFGWLAPVGSRAADDSATLRETKAEPVAATAAADEDGQAAVGKQRLRFLPRFHPFTRKEKTPIRATFRFENVRVVCNELHDTDFIIKT